MRNANRLSGQNELERSACARRLCQFLLLLAGVNSCFSGAAWAQKPDSQASDSDRSWTATSESKEDNANPTRQNELERSACARRLCQFLLLLAGVNSCFSGAAWAQKQEF